MFGWFKKKPNDEKKSKIDKLIMGAIVGGAIGSVVGMSIAPKKGSETREYLNKKSKEMLKRGQGISQQLGEQYQTKVGHKNWNKLKTLLTKIMPLNTLFSRFKKISFLRKKGLRKIPHEQFHPRDTNNAQQHDEIDVIKF